MKVSLLVLFFVAVATVLASGTEDKVPAPETNSKIGMTDGEKEAADDQAEKLKSDGRVTAETGANLAKDAAEALKEESNKKVYGFKKTVNSGVERATDFVNKVTNPIHDNPVGRYVTKNTSPFFRGFLVGTAGSLAVPAGYAWYNNKNAGNVKVLRSTRLTNGAPRARVEQRKEVRVTEQRV